MLQECIMRTSACMKFEAVSTFIRYLFVNELWVFIHSFSPSDSFFKSFERFLRSASRTINALHYDIFSRSLHIIFANE